MEDPVEVALVGRLQQSAMAHVAESTSASYVGSWNAFVSWCGSLARPRRALPADDMTVAMYLQVVADGAQSFAPVKQASASIAFFQKVNLYSHLPTQSPEACMVRGAAARKFGLAPKNRKTPFKWEQVVAFATAYGVRYQGYCHLVVATMAVIMFGAMCRYNDVSRLVWSNIRFELDGSAFEITFSKRKNSQYRQGSKVIVSAAPAAAVCPLRLLQQLRAYTGASPEGFVFRGFDGKLVAKSPGRTLPGKDFISYSQFARFLSLWFGGVLGCSAAEFKAQFGTQSGRSGGASAASNAGVPLELWGQHGDWKSMSAQRCYMARDTAALLSVSRAAMGQQGQASAASAGLPEKDIRQEEENPALESASDMASTVEVEGVPAGAFRWLGRAA